MNRSITFGDGEWYHCYARGIDKRRVFSSQKDYDRFLMLLYTCNSDTPVHISNVNRSNQSPTLSEVLQTTKGNPLVEIGTYCLMPNHYHLLIRQSKENGLTQFMRKLGTGYTMYFNIKNNRTGPLFSGKFKANHVNTDQYLKRVAHYIHANPAELHEPKWKEGVIKDGSTLKTFLKNYRFSSLLDYEGNERLETKILNKEALVSVLDSHLNLQELLRDAQDFMKN